MNENTIYDRLSSAGDQAIKAYANMSGLNIVEHIGEGEVPEGAVTVTEAAERLKASEEYVTALLTGKSHTVPKISIQEAMATTDAPIVMRRVIDNVLNMPKEPNYWFLNNAAEVINVDPQVGQIEFTDVGPISASFIAQNQQYPVATLDFAQSMVSTRTQRVGVMVPLPEGLMRSSQWDIMRIALTAVSRAIDRFEEELLFRAATSSAQVVFDNSGANQTTGKDADGITNNLSFSYYDLVKMTGAVVAKRFTPDTVMTHPMAWSIFALDPLIRAQFLHGGQIGQSIWSTAPQFDQQMNLPFAMQYVPYFAVNFEESKSVAGKPASQVSDVYVFDRRNILYLLQGSQKEIDNFEEMRNDTTYIKGKKYTGVSARHDGNAIVVAKDVRLVRNYEPIMTVKQV